VYFARDPFQRFPAAPADNYSMSTRHVSCGRCADSAAPASDEYYRPILLFGVQDYYRP
jgi:hypothetical protein